MESLTARSSPQYVVLLAALIAAACGSTAGGGGAQIIQPGAPGGSSRVITAEQAADVSQVQYTAADVRFMQSMIAHHAQALEMTALLRTRTASEDLRKLAERMDISQADEITMMREWLEARGEAVPATHAHHDSGALMPGTIPGMLTPADMARLANATGEAFDRLFLQLMITHHEGAIAMVKDLFATRGAGQDADIYTFASDVDADQRMEIARMRAMLASLKEPQR